MLAIIIWSITNNIKFKAFDQLFVTFNNMVLNAQEPAEHYLKLIHYLEIFIVFQTAYNIDLIIYLLSKISYLS